MLRHSPLFIVVFDREIVGGPAAAFHSCWNADALVRSERNRVRKFVRPAGSLRTRASAFLHFSILYTCIRQTPWPPGAAGAINILPVSFTLSVPRIIWFPPLSRTFRS